jgi:4-hydroxy-tetrahydrodipicolinate synthase
VTTGVMTAFNADESFDWASIERHIDFLRGSGIKALLANAMMAEGLHLTRQEREITLAFIASRVGTSLPLIATVYGANTAEAADEAYRAAHLGAQAVLVYPHPAFGGHPLDIDLPIAYFRAIHQRCGLPVIVFRTAAASAPSMGIDVIERLADEKGILGVKDSAADAALYEGRGAALLQSDSPVKIFIDSDPVMLDYVRRGAYGAMSLSAAVFPRAYSEMFSQSGSAQAAEVSQCLSTFAHLVSRLPKRNFRARLKEALQHRGIFSSSRVRPPLPGLSDVERSEVIASFSLVEESLATI